MAKEIIEKKLHQLALIIRRLAILLECPFTDFKNNERDIAASERNFQLIVDFTCDINSQILFENDDVASDTYVQSFLSMSKIKIIPYELAQVLAEGAKLRNILVHEYDFIKSDEKFYDSAKRILPAYEEYARAIYAYIEKKTD